mgnify:CR=1 FL=1
MRNLNIDELKTLNETPDKYGTLAIRLLSELIIIAHNDDQFILVLVSTIIKVSLKYPCSYLFGYTMGIYGFILGHVFKNIKESIRFGEFSYSFINDIADLDIILLGMIAGFIILRLRNILGRKTGHESKVFPSFAEKEFNLPKNEIKPVKQNLETLEGKDKKEFLRGAEIAYESVLTCLLYTSPSPRDS